MKKIFFSAVFMLGILSAFAQTKCPDVRVSCPDEAKENESLTYTANVSGGDQNVTPTYNWMISAGSISSGQGTSTITVDLTGTGGQTITATVDVGGYDRSCSTSSSCTTMIMAAPKTEKKQVQKTKITKGKKVVKKKA